MAGTRGRVLFVGVLAAALVVPLAAMDARATPLHGTMAKKGKRGKCRAGFKRVGGKCRRIAATRPTATPSPTARATPTATTTSVDITQGTYQLAGDMTSTYNLTMTGKLPIKHATNIHWDLPLPTPLSLNGYTETFGADTFTFSVPPDSSVDTTDDQGRPVREFTWVAPPDNTVIAVTQTLTATVKVSLTPFDSAATLPLSNLPADVQPYAQPNAMTTLPPSAAGLISRLRGTSASEEEVVVAVANWVAANDTYSRARNNGPFDAAWVFANRQANCRGFDNVMAGILRAMGIPTQAQWGWVTAEPIPFPGPDGARATLQWSLPGTSGEMHTWLNVYFPDRGWVPFDSQAEKFFIDSRHLGFLVNNDGGDPGIGTVWSDDTIDGALSSPQILPAFGGSESIVTERSSDSFSVKFVSFTPDITGKLLFSR